MRLEHRLYCALFAQRAPVNCHGWTPMLWGLLWLNHHVWLLLVRRLANNHAGLTLESEINCSHWFYYCASSEGCNSWGPLSPNSVTEWRLIKQLTTNSSPPSSLPSVHNPWKMTSMGITVRRSAKTRQLAVLAPFRHASSSFYSLLVSHSELGAWEQHGSSVSSQLLFLSGRLALLLWG